MKLNRRSLLAGLFGAAVATPSLAEQIRAIPAEPQPRPDLCQYTGVGAYDAGLFYCPYVPLQFTTARAHAAMNMSIGFKTRYGVIANAA